MYNKRETTVISDKKGETKVKKLLQIYIKKGKYNEKQKPIREKNMKKKKKIKTKNL